MANAIAGVTGLKSAELREVESSRHISIRIAAEVVQVALANGVDVQPISGVPPQMFVDAVSDESIMGEVEGILMSGAKEIGIGRPSLAQDLLKGRKIEVDYNIKNTYRAVGTRLSHYLYKEFGDKEIKKNSIIINLSGSAGQS